VETIKNPTNKVIVLHNRRYLSEIYLFLDQRSNTSLFITARTSSGLKGTPMSFNKIGALKFSGMIFLNIIQNMVEVERFRENQNHN